MEDLNKMIVASVYGFCNGLFVGFTAYKADPGVRVLGYGLSEVSSALPPYLMTGSQDIYDALIPAAAAGLGLLISSSYMKSKQFKIDVQYLMRKMAEISYFNPNDEMYSASNVSFDAGMERAKSAYTRRRQKKTLIGLERMVYDWRQFNDDMEKFNDTKDDGLIKRKVLVQRDAKSRSVIVQVGDKLYQLEDYANPIYDNSSKQDIMMHAMVNGGDPLEWDGTLDMMRNYVKEANGALLIK